MKERRDQLADAVTQAKEVGGRARRQASTGKWMDLSHMGFSVVSLRLIHIIACIRISSLRLNNISLCVCVCIYIYIYTYKTHFVYSFICRWTFESFTPFGYCELCCCEHAFA